MPARDGMVDDTRPGPAAASLYERLGGDAGVRALVDRFYDLMDLEPAFAQTADWMRNREA